MARYLKWGRRMTADERSLINEAEQLAAKLVDIVKRLDALETSDRNDNDRPVVHLADGIAVDVLTAAKVNNMGGCDLCRG